jgi:cell division protein FtsB
MRIPKIFFILFAISFLLSLYLLLDEEGIFTFIHQKKKIEELEERITSLENEISEIKTKIDLLTKGDLSYLEHVFRKFGWVKKDEKILKIEESSPPAYEQNRGQYHELKNQE